jgi:hypothetical protein
MERTEQQQESLLPTVLHAAIILAKIAAASLVLLSQLGNEPSNATAERIGADLQAAMAASGTGESKRRPSRAAAVGADSAETAPPNSLGCQCEYQL